MTREEAIYILNNLKPTNTKSSFDAYVVGKAITMAIKALEQESCADCISRQAVLDKIKEICFSKEQKWVDFRVSQGSNGQRDLIIKFIESLPSVQPKPKYVAVGNVNFDKDELQKIIDKVNPTIMPEIEYRKAHWQNNACSNCGIYNASAYKNWCPNCGAKMLEPQERSDKE